MRIARERTNGNHGDHTSFDVFFPLPMYTLHVCVCVCAMRTIICELICDVFCDNSSALAERYTHDPALEQTFFVRVILFRLG